MVGESGLTVYKVVVETSEYPFAFNSDPLIGFKVTGDPFYWAEHQFKEERKYHTIFTNTEVWLNTLMCDDMAYEYAYGEDIGPGYYHFFETKYDAEKFLERIVGICNFQKNSRPCILVGEIPSGELYNEGTFYFYGVLFRSIIARKVYYSGELYYG